MFEGKEDNNNNLDNNDNFAFISNGEIVINGKGTVQIIDMLGHVLFTGEIDSSLVAGVYVLRLINGEAMKTQKIVLP